MSDNPSSLPNAQVVANPEGGYIVLMHLGDKLRAFMSDGMDRVRKLMVDVGLNEFGLDQPTAEAVADASVQKHVDDAAAAAATPALAADPAAPAPTDAEFAEVEPAAAPAASDDPLPAEPAATDEPVEGDYAAAASEEDADAVAADTDAAAHADAPKDADNG